MNREKATESEELPGYYGRITIVNGFRVNALGRIIICFAWPHGVFNPTTGLNRIDAPSRFVRTRTLGAEDETEFDAYVIVYAERNWATTSLYAFCRSSNRRIG
jgi:hypothetical protein